MVDETRYGKKKPDDSHQDHTSHKVIALVDKTKLDAILKQNFSNKPSLERLKPNSDDQPRGFRLKPVINTHVHKSKFIGLSLALYALENFSAAVQRLVFELYWVVLELAPALDRRFDHWE